jgi:two-component system cell cycle sensor histidine kinase/response regulator CckA
MTDNIAGICWLLDPRTLETIHVSPAFETLCGRTFSTLDPILYRTLIHSDDIDRVLLAVSELQPTTHTVQHFRIISSSGVVKWMSTTISLYVHRDSHLVVLMDMAVDTSVRRQIHEALEARGDCYPRHVESSCDLICFHNLDGTIVSFNDRAAEILGYSRDELLNTPMRKFIPVEEYEEFDRYLSRMRMSGSASGLMSIVTKTGQRRVWEYCNTLHMKGAGEPIVRGVAHDVTDQKRIEEALRSSEENFSKVFMSSPLAIAITTLEGGEIVDVNEVFVKQTGVSRSEVIGKNASDLEVWVDARQQSHIMEEIRGGGRVQSQEVQFRNKSGAIQTQLYSAEPIRIGGKQCLIAVYEDITQRKFAEDTLKQSEANYRSLFLSSPCGMYRVALDGKFIFVNDALVELLGYDSADELLSKNLEEDIYANPDGRNRIVDSVQYLNPLKSVEVQWRRKNGTLIVVRAHATGWVNNEFGQVVGLETMVEDITKQGILEEQLRQMQKIESLALLAGGIAHDFNNVLTAVLGYGQLALKTLNRTKAEVQTSSVNPHRDSHLQILDKTTTQLQHIVDAAFHGQALTSQLLAFSRHESLPIYPLNLDVEIENIAEMIRRLIGEHIKVQLRLDCKSQTILGEKGAFGQIILNLCVNARDAMPKGGQLTVRTFSATVKAACEEHVGVPCGSYVVLEVADTGCGMRKAIQERIFEPFFTTKPAGHGTGLGLYTVYAILHRCGGHIRIQSEPGRGSTFRLYLPVVDASLTQSRAAPDCRVEGQDTGIVMVVEDDDRVREIVSSHLTSLGFQVLCEADPVVAVRDYDRLNGDIELLVTDVVMPGLTGPALVRQLKERQPNLRVLYMTGWASADILPPGLLCEGAELLRKPFDEFAFKSIIRDLLCRPKAISREIKLSAFAAEA